MENVFLLVNLVTLVTKFLDGALNVVVTESLALTTKKIVRTTV